MTHINDIVDPDELNQCIADGLIGVRKSEDLQYIYNYTDRAMYTPGAWNYNAVRQCRGLIVDQTGHIIARPWAKFFNYGQAEAGALDMDAPADVTDKMDGSLGILHYSRNGNRRVATRGSFESDQAIHATEVLLKKYYNFYWPQTVTPLVEIIYKENRIVCDYGDQDDLVLLGMVANNSGMYYGPRYTKTTLMWEGPVAKTFEYKTLRDALEAPPRKGAEGMVVRYKGTNHMVKIKQEDYINLHRIVTGLSERSIWQSMVDVKTLDELLEGIPDELHEWVTQVWRGIYEDVDYDFEEAKRRFDWLEATVGRKSRKEFAAAVMGNGTEQSRFAPWLFMLKDGKDIGASVLKYHKPRGDKRAKRITEDVA